MKRDPLLWAALAAALVVTASAEYSLARSAGFGTVVAGGVPTALDVYVIRALRARRDVAAVVLAMIAVNAASHLVAAGLLPVSVPLVVAVSAIAPLVLWRVHRLAEHIEQEVNTPREGLHNIQAPATEVYTKPHLLDVIQEVPPTPEPQVICGAQWVYELAVPPVLDESEVNSRLDAEQARMLIEYAWANGSSTREAARVSTRSPSYVSKVYARLEQESDGPAQLALAPVAVTA